MVYSLLFSLGTPVLFYGEEIGMGENLEIEGRLSVGRRCSGSTGRTVILRRAAVTADAAGHRGAIRSDGRERGGAAPRS